MNNLKNNDKSCNYLTIINKQQQCTMMATPEHHMYSA